MKKKLAIGFAGLVVLLLIVGGVWLVFSGNSQYSKLINEKTYSQLKSDCQKRMAEADSITQLEELKKIADTLNDKDKKEFLRMLNLKIARWHFLLAEEKIYRARQLAELTEEDSSPFVDHYINESFAHYQKAKEKIDELLEATNDDVYNFHLYYTKGNIYYRVLMFLAKQDEAMEIFNQTALAWETALRFKNKDVDTEINLEVLYQKQRQLTGMPQRGRGERVRMLPILPKPGPGIGGGVPHGHF